MENEENRGNRRQPMGETDTDQFFQCHLTSEVKFRDCLLLDNAYITTTSLFDCLKKKIRIRNYHRNKSLIHIIGSSQYLLSWSFSEVYPLHFQASLWLKGDKLSTSNNVKLLSKPKKFCVANFFQVMFYYTI